MSPALPPLCGPRSPARGRGRSSSRPAHRRVPRPCGRLSASIRVCSGNRSRKMPERVITTSIRGRPSSLERGSGRRRRGGHSHRKRGLRAISASAWADRATVRFDVAPSPRGRELTERGNASAASIRRCACFAPSCSAKKRWACGTGRRRGCCAPSAEPRANGSGRRPERARCTDPRECAHQAGQFRLLPQQMFDPAPRCRGLFPP